MKKLSYQQSATELFQEFNTGPEGLTSAEVQKRLEQFGPNTFKSGKEFDILKTLIHQFTDPLIYILIIAAIITSLLGHWIDTWVIMAVVVLNAVIGFTQELKAEKAIGELISLAAPKATVLRDNDMVEVNSSTLVPGDVILLASGTKVPADLRLFEATRLEVNESALTGESLGVTKNTAPLKTDQPALGEARNTAFMGTLVLSGRGKGLVVATGRKTQLGRISDEVAALESAPTPLQVELARMSRKIGVAVLGVSLFAVVLGLLLGRAFVHMLLTGIALAVGAIPEGLPIVVTITLAIGVKRMTGRNAIVRRLPAVETLGSTTVIASDKTGTLTKNEMTVQNIFAGYQPYQVTGTGFSPLGEIKREGDVHEEPHNNNVALEMILRAGLLANESALKFNQEKGEHTPQGDPTEVSLIVSALKGGLQEDLERIHYPKFDEIPFESERLYMASLHHDIKSGGSIVFVKGAPDRVLGMSAVAMDQQGAEVSLDFEQVLDKYQTMGQDGLRVLAMAYKRWPGEVTAIEPAMLEEGLTFIGLQAMVDPPREEAFEAVKQAKKAGVRVIMVTGDHKITALAIASRLGITKRDSPVISGQELEQMSDDELFEQVGKVSLFSRVAPLQKLRIVQQLIRRGEVVAVTGDGVNDTPALKAAHIGIAMGRTGTDAAKETSEMVITDDNFASIFAAVKEGRVVFANIRKVTLFLLSTGLGQVILILAALVLFLPLPLLPAQILWMNLVTNGLQDVALGFEPGEKGIEDQPPRHPAEPVISRLMIERLLVIGVVLAAGTLATFVWQLNIGASIDKARTVALTTMVLFQLFNVFNARSERLSIFQMSMLSNPFLFYSIIASIMAQLAIIYVPAFHFIFRTTPLNITDWLVILPTALTVIVAVEIDKALRRKTGMVDLVPAEN